MTRARLGVEYKPSEWVEFFADLEPGTLPASARVLAVKVRTLAAKAFYAWREREDYRGGIRARHFALAAPESRDRLAYLTYASIVGHGVGLWEGDFLREIYSGPDGSEGLDALSDSLDAYMKEAASEVRVELHAAVSRLDEWIADQRWHSEEE